MEPNGTELKVSPLLATRNEAKQGHNQGRQAHRIRVSGGPNEATVASFPASAIGVNEAKQGQIGPGPPPVVSTQTRNLASHTPAPSFYPTIALTVYGMPV